MVYQAVVQWIDCQFDQWSQWQSIVRLRPTLRVPSVIHIPNGHGVDQRGDAPMYDDHHAAYPTLQRSDGTAFVYSNQHANVLRCGRCLAGFL